MAGRWLRASVAAVAIGMALLQAAPAQPAVSSAHVGGAGRFRQRTHDISSGGHGTGAQRCGFPAMPARRR
jgi:hypothetical protein